MTDELGKIAALLNMIGVIKGDVMTYRQTKKLTNIKNNTFEDLDQFLLQLEEEVKRLKQ